MGEAMIVNYDGVALAVGGNRPDEIVAAEVRPDLVREARVHWSVENNPYEFGHRGYVAVKGGATDCPYTYMHDLLADHYRLPWEDEVVHIDGTSCGFAPPDRVSEVDLSALTGPIDDVRMTLRSRGFLWVRHESWMASRRW